MEGGSDQANGTGPSGRRVDLPRNTFGLELTSQPSVSPPTVPPASPPVTPPTMPSSTSFSAKTHTAATAKSPDDRSRHPTSCGDPVVECTSHCQVERLTKKHHLDTLHRVRDASQQTVQINNDDDDNHDPPLEPRRGASSRGQLVGTARWHYSCRRYGEGVGEIRIASDPAHRIALLDIIGSSVRLAATATSPFDAA
jgi:hypothetical protein